MARIMKFLVVDLPMTLFIFSVTTSAVSSSISSIHLEPEGNEIHQRKNEISETKVMNSSPTLPLVVNTWNVTKATRKAWEALSQHGECAVDAVVAGCSVCQDGSCGSSIGKGGSPDEHGETALDAMIMDGQTMDVGSVGNLRNIQSAIEVARAIMKYTKHTLLVGDLATEFALAMGFKKIDLGTNSSHTQWKDWENSQCQPNFWQNVSPDPKTSCGPYRPDSESLSKYEEMLRRSGYSPRYNPNTDPEHHDTIGMVVVAGDGNVASGTTTNGANHKIPGRVGDSPIVGAGSYAQNDVGGAAATGDGDVMMRFSPCFYTVQLMAGELSPTQATRRAIAFIQKYYPHNSAAIVAVSATGQHGAACMGFSSFQYNVVNNTGIVNTITITCS